MTDKLTTREILELKARAHHLNPVVMIGQHGLTDSVIKETDAALTAHELIKVARGSWVSYLKMASQLTFIYIRSLPKARRLRREYQSTG